MTVDRAALRALLAKATPAPWEPGAIWLEAGVKAEMFGAGQCTYCHLGPAEWTGDMDVNGTVMPAHRHRHPEPYEPDHRISGPDGATVAGNYDYEAGGIVRPEDLALAVAARNGLPALLDQLDAAEDEAERLRRRLVDEMDYDDDNGDSLEGAIDEALRRARLGEEADRQLDAADEALRRARDLVGQMADADGMDLNRLGMSAQDVLDAAIARLTTTTGGTE